jgi:hypothetical protein
MVYSFFYRASLLCGQHIRQICLPGNRYILCRARAAKQRNKARGHTSAQKCVHCNALCDVRFRYRTKAIARHARIRMLGSIGFFLFLQLTTDAFYALVWPQPNGANFETGNFPLELYGELNHNCRQSKVITKLNSLSTITLKGLG